MKKIFLVIVLLTTFSLSPVKADSYENDPYFIAVSTLDLTQLGMGSEEQMLINWYFDHLPPVKYIYKEKPRMVNMTQILVTGTATIDAGNGVTLEASFTWRPFDDYATLTYMGLDFTADNWLPYENGQFTDEYVTGNGYEWWSDNSPSQVDLTIAESCLLIILFICAANLICGKE